LKGRKRKIGSSKKPEPHEQGVKERQKKKEKMRKKETQPEQGSKNQRDRSPGGTRQKWGGYEWKHETCAKRRQGEQLSRRGTKSG